jgi:hypothetical protein
MMGNICTTNIENPIKDTNMDEFSTISSYNREQFSHLYDEKGDFIKPVAEPKLSFQNKNNTQTVEQIMTKLENDGFQVASSTLNDTTITPANAADKLINFMNDGAKQFEKETGRQMTYAEMRAMWG